MKNTIRCEFCSNWAKLTQDGQVDCPRCGKYPVQNDKPPFTFNVYYGFDGTPVVHVQTDDLPEDAKGPICRIYLNEEAIYENPPLAEAEEVEDD